MTRTHVPVLAGELIEALDPAPGSLAVDCTFGAGGHARLVAERLGAAGEIVCIDRDPQAEEHFTELASEVACATRFIAGNYADVLPELHRGGAAGGPPLYGPRHLLDAGGRVGARLLLFLRRAARHAHGHLAGARRAHDPERVARGPPGRDHPRVRRGALRAPHRARDRAPPRARADRHHHGAGGRDQARRADTRAVRGRSPARAAPSRRSGSRSTTSSARSSARCPPRGSCCAPAAGWR